MKYLIGFVLGVLLTVLAYEPDPATQMPAEQLVDKVTVLTGPFLIRDGVTFDQETEQPVNGLWVRKAEVWRYESPYKNGRLHGVSKTFLSNGRLVRKTAYKNGLKHGLDESFDYGHLMESTAYFEGQRHGLSRSYDRNQRLVQQGQYVNGKREGYWLDESPSLSVNMREGEIIRESGNGYYLEGIRSIGNGDSFTPVTREQKN